MRFPSRGRLGSLWWHWSNENEDDRGEVVGSGLWHGRAWFNYDPEDGRPGPAKALALEWCLGRFSKMCGLSIGRDDGERELVASIRLPHLFSLYVSVRGLLGRLEYGSSRELSVSIHDGSVWWRVWADPDSWESTRPRWRDGSWNLLDALLGKVSVETRVLEVRQVEIPFPERTYRATVTLQAKLERRPRWPGVWGRWRGADIEPEVPVPEPGKGENSWDCGQDACYAMWTGGVRDIHEAVERFRSSILRTRERRGGRDWRPEEKRT